VQQPLGIALAHLRAAASSLWKRTLDVEHPHGRPHERIRAEADRSAFHPRPVILRFSDFKTLAESQCGALTGST